ncbi:MAG: hypothetical protein KKA81_14030, partial [Bacteroidetes bacterium]|nr:hypothetical protein [Bacteroidota bacterium]
PVIHATVMMKTGMVKDLGGYRTEFLTSEDVDLWLRILDKHRIAVLNQCYYFVRLNPTSATVRHQSSVNFYRELALTFAAERRNSGSDPLMRGENMPLPPPAEPAPEKSLPRPGTFVRDDLSFYYNITVNARDCVNWRKTASIILHNGWKKRQTYRLLLFPLIGRNLVKTGSGIKSWFRKKNHSQ